MIGGYPSKCLRYSSSETPLLVNLKQGKAAKPARRDWKDVKRWHTQSSMSYVLSCTLQTFLPPLLACSSVPPHHTLLVVVLRCLCWSILLQDPCCLCPPPSIAGTPCMHRMLKHVDKTLDRPHVKLFLGGQGEWPYDLTWSRWGKTQPIWKHTYNYRTQRPTTSNIGLFHAQAFTGWAPFVCDIPKRIMNPQRWSPLLHLISVNWHLWYPHQTNDVILLLQLHVLTAHLAWPHRVGRRHCQALALNRRVPLGCWCLCWCQC